MNEQEKKQWLEDRKDKIRKLCDLMREDNKRETIQYCGEYTEEDEKVGRLIADKIYNKMLSEYNIPETGDKEEVCGIDLKPYLALIRSLEDHEESITLFIKNSKVIDQKIIRGTGSVVLDRKVHEEIINKALELDAGIYMCHNHPLKTYAQFSKTDVQNRNNYLLPMAKEANVDVLGVGVVTFNDYCEAIKKAS